MFEFFTTEAIDIIVAAQELGRYKHVGAEHILLGLLSLGKGIAFSALKEFEVTLDAARSAVDEIVSDTDSAPVTVQVPFTPRVKRVLELAWDEARQLRQNYVGPEHLLLGLLREGEGVSVTVLYGLGVDLTKLRHRVLELIAEFEKKGES